jgi:phage/plasmid-associated DNA primase
MVKKGKGVFRKPELTLFEKVDVDILKRLISSRNIEPLIKEQLKKYFMKYNKDLDVIKVDYYFSKKLEESGRLYAGKSLSLQNFRKDIRQALASRYYYDIDFVNSHPTLISQYCKKNNINCPYLDKYVSKREDILEEICLFHDIERDKAKKLVLKMCYLGRYTINDEEVEEEEQNGFLRKFRKELKHVSKDISNIKENKEIFEKVNKDETKTNKLASLLSIKSQILEHSCLMSLYKFLSNEGFIVGCLCFDGLLLRCNKRFTENMEDILKRGQDFIYKETGYKILITEKSMDEELKFELPEYSCYVTSDADAQEKLFLIEGKKKFKYCEGQLYIFDEKTGIFSTEKETLFYYLHKNKDYLRIILNITKEGKEIEENYGTSTSYQQRVIPQVKRAAQDKNWLRNTSDSSLGYLLFKDGIYDIKESKFTKGFNPDIVFHGNIPWNFPKYDKKKIDKARKVSFDRLFANPEQMIYALARAMAGDIGIKSFYFSPGNPNAGKSIFIRMVQLAFGDFVGSFNLESLSYIPNDSREESVKNRWLLLLRFKRALFSSEGDMKKSLSGHGIKRAASGADKSVGRDHGKGEVSFMPHCTFFCMLNDIPKIEPTDKGVEERLKYIEFPYVFTTKDKLGNNENNKEMDPELIKKINTEDFISGFIHIILDGYKSFLENGPPEFDNKLKEIWLEGTKQDSSSLDTIKATYEITKNNNDYITVHDINRFKNNNKVFETMSNQKFNKLLRITLGLGEATKKNERVWTGIKLKPN